MKLTDVTMDKDLTAATRATTRAETQAQSAQESADPTRQASATEPADSLSIESVTRQIDSFLRSMNRSLQFSVDETTGRTVVSVCDAETGEVIRQVPGEDALRLAQRIEAGLSTMLDEKV